MLRRIFSDKHNAERYQWSAEAMHNGERLCVFTTSMLIASRRRCKSEVA
jgi:hypothetical protein